MVYYHAYDIQCKNENRPGVEIQAKLINQVWPITFGQTIDIKVNMTEKCQAQHFQKEVRLLCWCKKSLFYQFITIKTC